MSFISAPASAPAASDIISLDDLTQPFIVAHRGGSVVYPENTMEAFHAIANIAAANGIDIAMETDVHKLADSGLGMMHDATVDRITTATGNITDHNTATWQNLIADTNSWFPGTRYGNLSVPLFGDFLREFGRRFVTAPEVKAQAAGPLMAAEVEHLGLASSVFPNAFTASWLQPLADVGCTCALIDTDGLNAGVPWTLAQTAPATWIFVDHLSVADATITTLLANGLKVGVYTMQSHYKRDQYAALGVNAYVSDDPIYLYATPTVAPHRRTTDTFADKTPWHGFRGHTSANTIVNPVFFGADRCGFDSTFTPTTCFLFHGEICPLANTAYTLGVTMTYENIESSSTWLGVGFSITEDRPFAAGGASTTAANGYVFRIQTDGTMRLHRWNSDGTTVQIGSNTPSAAIVAGQAVPITIVVDATSITCTRTDTLHSITSSNSDAQAYRGRYIHYGRSGVSQQCSFSDVSVT